MKLALAVFLLLPTLFQPLSAQASETCRIDAASKSGSPPGAWISLDNWLSPEFVRLSLREPGRFMAMKKISSTAKPLLLKNAPRALDLAKITTLDPLDQAERTLESLLNTRLYAEGLLVMRNGRVVSERYWHGLSAQQPRPLLGATRPVLSLLGAMGLAQGKLSADKSVIRHIPALAAQTGLRKLSMQRLIEAKSRFAWSAKDLDAWQVAAGWRPGSSEKGMRAWLNQPERWDMGFSDTRPTPADASPEDDLLAWALTETYKAPLAQIFCDNVLAKLRPEAPVAWLTDEDGTELSGGLALTLRDFGRLGQMLIEARGAGNRSKIPGWFIETLTSSSGNRKAKPSEIEGLMRGSELRYGFVHLGGAANRIALLGPYGSSLYIDFDRRLVIALYATYPREYSPALLAALEQAWEAIGTAAHKQK